MKTKPDLLPIPEGLWIATMKETQSRILILLDSSERLLRSGGDTALCAGLYTYAVEEYGKLMVLKQYKPVSGRVVIKYKNEFRNHMYKFPEATKNLLPECLLLRQGIFDPVIFDPAIFDTQSVTADFESRMAIFYTDFDDSGIKLQSIPSIDNSLLERAIIKLREIVLMVTIP